MGSKGTVHHLCTTANVPAWLLKCAPSRHQSLHPRPGRTGTLHMTAQYQLWHRHPARPCSGWSSARQQILVKLSGDAHSHAHARVGTPMFAASVQDQLAGQHSMSCHACMQLTAWNAWECSILRCCRKLLVCRHELAVAHTQARTGNLKQLCHLQQQQLGSQRGLVHVHEPGQLGQADGGV